MKYLIGLTVAVIIAILYFTRCDVTCQKTKHIAEKLQQAKIQQDLFNDYTSKAGEYWNLYQAELEKGKQAKMSQWKLEKEASNIYGSGLAFGNYAYAGWDEGLKEKAIPPILKDFYLEDCRITQEEDHHIKEGRGSMYATDIACERGKSFDVKAPSFTGEYKLSKGYDQKLGNYVSLEYGNKKIIFGHTNTQLKGGETVGKGAIIGNTDLSGISQNYHVHIELWSGKNNISLSGDINNKSSEILEQRKPKPDQVYYFTHYTLGDKLQNDNAPCNGASGKNLCDLQKQGIKTMALTKDIRLKLGVKRGDKVKLVGDQGCAGVYQVEDEMNCRFRGPNAHDNGTCYNRDGSIADGNIKRPGTKYFIKGDLPDVAGGACRIELVK